MKIEITGAEPNEPAIDWGKPQIMISSYTSWIVLSTGIHDDENFSGFSIKSNKMIVTLKKAHFTPLPTTQKLILSNE